MENCRIILFNLEEIVKSILLKYKIQFKKNFRIGMGESFRLFDFYLLDFGVLIECDGDYWHGNPLFFSRLNETQIKNVNNDRLKDELAHKNGYEILRFWECEINQDDFEKRFLERVNSGEKDKD